MDVQALVNSGAKEVTIGDDGVLRQFGRICVPKVDDLRDLILEKAHSSWSSMSIRDRLVCVPKVGLVWFELSAGRICVPKVDDLRDLILEKAHSSWSSMSIRDRLVCVPKVGLVWFELSAGRICVPKVDDLRDLILEKAHSSWGQWDQFLPLAKFTYNNNYQSSIQMAPYEALYGRLCHSLVGWFEPAEAKLLGTDLVRDALEKVKLIRKQLHIAQSRQKSYADRKVHDVAFMEVLERVSEVAYRIVFPPSLSGVHPVFHVSMLQKYHEDQSHVLDFSSVQLDENLAYKEEPMAILDKQI
ncbi:uncharacterized protein [Nicotiana tomentosiformis]|uniref:uncharacterized protein n=1 Tax=Nicotiana tomentosiformis TaxID=4098 RepID=UPI00388C4FDB